MFHYLQCLDSLVAFVLIIVPVTSKNVHIRRHLTEIAKCVYQSFKVIVALHFRQNFSFQCFFLFGLLVYCFVQEEIDITSRSIIVFDFHSTSKLQKKRKEEKKIKTH